MNRSTGQIDGRTKLPNEQVKAMRRRYAEGFTKGHAGERAHRNARWISITALAEENGISFRYAHSLLSGDARGSVR